MFFEKNRLIWGREKWVYEGAGRFVGCLFSFLGVTC